jgi:aspartate 1-decarboxylase
MICLNGPASHLVSLGDTIIIMAYATMDFELAKQFKPSVIFPNEHNLL